jgi:DNA-binding transcriptional regulator YhcF (GntR family)
MNFNPNRPIYIQICDSIIERIVRNDLKKGSQLESVRELAVSLNVNINTVRKAYNTLEDKNIIYKKRGIGTFITEDGALIKTLRKELSKRVIHEFLEKMHAIGYSDQEILEAIGEDLNDIEN